MRDACAIDFHDFSNQLRDQLPQDMFLKNIRLELEQQEQVKVRVKAQWASEQKMKDVLKLSEPLGCFSGMKLTPPQLLLLIFFY